MSKIIIVVFAITALVAMKTAASDEAEQDMAKLKSLDPNAQYDAIDSLEQMAAKQGVLPKDLNRKDVETYLKGWGGNSGKAALLLGRHGDKEAIPVLKRAKEEAEQIERKADPMDHRNNLAPKVRLACLKALLRLQDEETMRDVRSLIQSSKVEDRVQGIECVSFANAQTFISDIEPLLDDKRDAVNIAPSGGAYFLRVCDLAVDAIVDLGKVKTSFTVQRGAKYSDEQIVEVRNAVHQPK